MLLAHSQDSDTIERSRHQQKFWKMILSSGSENLDKGDMGTPADLKRGRRHVTQSHRRPAVFLDRDGVLNRDHGYVHRTEDFEWIEGAKKAIRLLNDRGYWVFVITNQAGIARGYYKKADVERLHRWMNAELEKSGAHVDRFYFCPHHPDFDGECECRKPKPGMISQALSDWPVDPSGSFLIGDKVTDLQAAEHAQIPGHIFESGNLYDALTQIIGTRP
jgi:D-glycero-D-manno-heptose 1,7-bisphosphate phosphatase